MNAYVFGHVAVSNRRNKTTNSSTVSKLPASGKKQNAGVHSTAVRPVLKRGKTKAKAKSDFAVGEHVVYPVHGVGQIISIEQQCLGSRCMELLSISFPRDRMIVRIPKERVSKTGLRHPIAPEGLNDVFAVLKAQKRVRRGMWCRKAHDYEAKINSGDPLLVAEVVRDLHRTEAMQDPSYSERQLYSCAIDRLAGEIATVKVIQLEQAIRLVEGVLTDSA